MRLRLLALSTTTLLLSACGGDDAPVISCAANEFNAVDAKLALPASLAAAHSELRVSLVSKESNHNIAQEGSKLSCIRDIKECTGSISTEKAHPGQYTLTAYDTKGLPVGSTAVEIKKASSEAGCSARLAASINTELKAYVLNLPLSGTLGDALQAALGANFWTGQSDGILMLSAQDLANLNQSQRLQIKDAAKAGKHVVVTHVTQADIKKASELLGMSAPITLNKSQPYLDFIALGSNDAAQIHGFGMVPVVGGTQVNEGWLPLGVEPEPQKMVRVKEFINWLKQPAATKTATVQSGLANPAGSGTGYVEIQNMPASFLWTHQYSVAYNTGTCNSKLLGPCYNTYQVTATAWPVYVSSFNNNITDYFIVTLGSNLSPQGCYGWYRGQGMDHENRIAAYWAQHYTYQASAFTPEQGFWGFDDLQINSNYQPNTASSSVDVTTGVTWNLSGTGSVGSSGASVGFSAGVSFSNTQQQTYTAMSATSNVAQSGQDNPSYARWDYDSKDYVKSTIVPSNRACGGPGFHFPSIDNTDVSATFSPQTTFLWQATKNVRETLAKSQGVAPYSSAGVTLPVKVELDVLLGWAYWSADYFQGQCKGPSGYVEETYKLDTGANAYISNTNPGIDSLIFDVSCETDTEFGTMPLGPKDHSGGDGNPGQATVLSSPFLNLPFASASTAPAN